MRADRARPATSRDRRPGAAQTGTRVCLLAGRPRDGGAGGRGAGTGGIGRGAANRARRGGLRRRRDGIRAGVVAGRVGWTHRLGIIARSEWRRRKGRPAPHSAPTFRGTLARVVLNGNPGRAKPTQTPKPAYLPRGAAELAENERQRATSTPGRSPGLTYHHTRRRKPEKAVDARQPTVDPTNPGYPRRNSAAEQRFLPDSWTSQRTSRPSHSVSARPSP
jgi:hypothetical protein